MIIKCRDSPKTKTIFLTLPGQGNFQGQAIITSESRDETSFIPLFQGQYVYRIDAQELFIECMNVHESLKKQ